ncbi:hypothetical protein THAOC_02116 [Thalassiosira oceanica]|uniref:Uncharacterized protein n=1 Tax=Thalassiosira oceanica TaxID=159749 RepID=K0TBR1_THAOC|nr:hypothetical protein THAOC_02116 [Thalassiosira oceanica]|eukprot:EJK76138.1 hypothetical protein THAOC_02116 [Thalassiosira oceanica]
MSGSPGCECVDMASKLQSFAGDRSCESLTGEEGVLLSLGGSCVDYAYGSGGCLQHDLIHDKDCQGVLNGTVMPRYCPQPWCYVDRDACKRNSDEEVRASDYFSNEGLFFSYTTCGGSSEAWMDHVENGTDPIQQNVLNGRQLLAAVPLLQLPNLFKRDSEGNVVLDRGDEYYDDASPFHGVYISYMKDLVRVSNGDIGGLNFTHVSRASNVEHPSSLGTAAVQDVANGLVDLAVAPYWITDERLAMTSYTVPLMYDKTVLVIPRPEGKKSLQFETAKVLQPFTPWLWVLVILVIATTAGLGVWFSDREKLAKKNYGKSLRKINRKIKTRFRRGEGGVNAKRKSKSVYGRLIVDGFLEKAFLVQTGTDEYVGTMQQAVTAGTVICAHPALETMLVRNWPQAKFEFDRSGNEWQGVLDLYRAGGCDVLAVGRENNMLSNKLMNQFCDEGLVFTDSVIVEAPIALPVRPEIASGLSYWIFRAEKYNGVSIANSAKKYVEMNGSPKCEIELSNLGGIKEADDLTSLSPKNMVFPIIFFCAFALFAILLHVFDERNHKKTGKHTLAGRRSTLELFDEKAIAAIGSILKDPEDNRPVKGGMTDALAAALAAPAQHGTDIGENVDAQAEPDCNDVLEHTSNDATLQELLESGAIDEALHTLSRLKQL